MTEQNLVRRIQKVLPDEERLHKVRPGSRFAEYGPYFIRNESNFLVAWGIDDLERLVAELNDAN